MCNILLASNLQRETRLIYNKNLLPQNGLSSQEMKSSHFGFI